MEKDPVFKLCDVIRETAFDLHRFLGPGHLEKVYENALLHRLLKRGVPAQQQVPLTVFDADGRPIGEFFADLLINGCLIIELKAVRSLADEHLAQLLGYLRAARIEHGLLINFGLPTFYIRKYAMSASRLQPPPGFTDQVIDHDYLQNL